MVVKYIKDFGESTEEILCSKEFPNTADRWDKEINNYTYNKLLELDSIYNFYDWENCESIDEVIYDNKGKIIHIENCVELYYNL